MPAKQELPTPIWSSDELISPAPPRSEPAYFDKALDAWVLSRHADVLTALRSPLLTMESHPPTEEETFTLHKMREDTLDALSYTQVRSWLSALAPSITRQVSQLKEQTTVDLVGGYLQPLCLELAAMATEIPLEEAQRLNEAAFHISAAAAEPSDDELRKRKRAVTPEFRSHFHSKTETLRDSGFVGLAHTLPSLIGNGCYALLQFPDQWDMLHRRPELMEQAVEELFRYTGLSRYLRRWATEDIVLGDLQIRKGDSLILRLIAANRDSERFQCPHQLNIVRREAGQLTLGSGPHACAGASLLRAAAAAILSPLLARFASASLVAPVTWRGGSGFRAPTVLPVMLYSGATPE